MSTLQGTTNTCLILSHPHILSMATDVWDDNCNSVTMINIVSEAGGNNLSTILTITIHLKSVYFAPNNYPVNIAFILVADITVDSIVRNRLILSLTLRLTSCMSPSSTATVKSSSCLIAYPRQPPKKLAAFTRRFMPRSTSPPSLQLSGT